MMPASATPPPPAIVRYNDWRRIPVASADGFIPALPVSVIVSYHEAPEALARTLAALETQDWPRDLFEVVIVDDGSRVPLERPASTLPDMRVVRQERREFGPARAHNAGVRAAAHGILLFLDGDMLPEAGWITAHARWHHAASGLLTLGFRAHAAADGVDAETIRQRPGTLQDLFAGRRADPPSFERHMAGTDELTSRNDDVFREVISSNVGIRRELYEAVGGFDESFVRREAEDEEFGYRAHTLGGVLVPVRQAFAWRQGRRAEERERRQRMLRVQRLKLAHLIAHEDFRDARPGRSFTVPQYVVTVPAADVPAGRIVETTARLLADRVHDLVVRIEMPEGDRRLEWIREDFGPDPRVRVAPALPALDEFSFAAFHVTVPAGAAFAPGLVHRLRCELGRAAAAQSILDDGSTVSIARAWMLHRSRRAARRAADFGDVVTVTARNLRIANETPPAFLGPDVDQHLRDLRAKARRLLVRVRRIRTPRHAWWFLQWLAGAVLWRTARCFRPGSRRRPRLVEPGGTADGADLPLGVEIAARGPRARAVLAASRRVTHRMPGHDADLVLADTPAETRPGALPVVALSQSPPRLSVPAFDPLADNPIGWVRAASGVAAALGPLEHLPPAAEARHVVDRRDRIGLRWIHHLEDVQAFHAGVTERAGELARLAANGVVVHLADRDPRLRPYLGAELHDSMLEDVLGADRAARRLLSIRMRRAALREHSLRSRARQICQAASLPDPPRPPLVSILLATRRPELLPAVLAMIARQRYPRLELVLGLHGAGFGEAERRLEPLRLPWKIVRVDAHVPFGSVLNEAVAASTGTLLAKMDDDDLYDTEHIWDLVLAHEYSGAQLVGKGFECVYLAGANRTVHCDRDGGEQYSDQVSGGGALLIARHDLELAGGWRRVRRHVDTALIADVTRAGGRIYRTHGAGFALVRHGHRHTWEMEDAHFLKQAEEVRAGWDPGPAGLADVPAPACAESRT